jgi:hypothetical protein
MFPPNNGHGHAKKDVLSLTNTLRSLLLTASAEQLDQHGHTEWKYGDLIKKKWCLSNKYKEFHGDILGYIGIRSKNICKIWMNLNSKQIIGKLRIDPLL